MSTVATAAPRRATAGRQPPAAEPTRPAPETAPPLIALQRSAGNHAVDRAMGAPSAPRSSAALAGLAGGARPLDTATRHEMEAKFGADFGEVRVHTDEGAAESASDLHAKAYTVGHDIVFGAGRYQPGSFDGKRLLAHELAHVVQQRRGGAPPPLSASAPHEHAADRAAASVAAGSAPVAVAGATGVGISRTPEEDDDFDRAFGATFITDEPEAAGQAPERSHQKPSRARRPSAAQRRNIAQEQKGAPLITQSKKQREDWQKEKKRAEGAKEKPRRQKPPPGYTAAVRQARKAQAKADVAKYAHVVHGDAPMTPLEMYRTVVAARAFDNSIGAHHQDTDAKRVAELDAQLAAATDVEAVESLKKERRQLLAKLSRQRRATKKQAGTGTPVAAPKPGSEPEALTKRIAEIDKQLAGNPTAKAQKEVAALRKRLGVSRGGAEAGIGNNTYAVVQVIGRDGKIIARVVARNDRRGHAEQNALTQIEAQLKSLGRKADLTGARVEVMGDQTVCPEVCAVALRKFGKRHGIKDVVGMTFHEKQPGVVDVKSDEDLKPPRRTAMGATKHGSPQHKDLHLRQESIYTGKDETPKAPPTGGGQPKSQTKKKPPPEEKPPTEADVTPESAPQKTAPKKKGEPPAQKKGPPLTPAPATQETEADVPGDGQPQAKQGKKPEDQKREQKPPTQKKHAPKKPPPLPAEKPAAPETGETPAQPQGTTGATQGKPRPIAKRPRVTVDGAVGAGGKAVATVEEILGSSPPMYRVTLTINLSASGSADIGVAGQRGGGNVGVSASGVLTGAFTQVLTREQKDAYLAAVRGGTGGAYPELSIVEMAVNNRLDQARAALAKANEVTSSAEGAKGLKEGEAADVTKETTLGADAGVSGGRFAQLGIQLGVFRTGRIVRTVSRQGGKIVVSITVFREAGQSLGGSLGAGVASMSYTRQTTEGVSRGATFVLDPEDPNFTAHFNELAAITSEEELVRVTGQRRELVATTTQGSDQSTLGTTTAGILGVGLSVLQGGTSGEETTYDAEGNVVAKTYRGGGTLGGGVVAGGRKVWGSQQRDEFVGTVEDENKARGQTSATKSETDVGKSVQQLNVIGVLTGSAPLLREKVDTEGKALPDESFARLAELAKDRSAWQKQWHGSVQTFVDWEETRQKVLAANGDRHLITKALAEFEEKGSGRSKTVENAVGETGIAFEFPDALAAEKPVYDALIVGDPLAHPRELAAAGDPAGAIAELESLNTRLGQLLSEIQRYTNEFTNPAHFAEMQQRITARRAQLRAEIRALKPSPAEPPGPGTEIREMRRLRLPPGGKRTKEWEAEEAARQKEITARLDAEQAEAERKAAAQRAAEKAEERNQTLHDNLSQCLAYRDKENAIFAQVNEEFNSSWFKPDVIDIANWLNSLKPTYALWDQAVNNVRAVFQERGDSPDRANQYAPNRAQWQALYNKAFGGY